MCSGVWLFCKWSLVLVLYCYKCILSGGVYKYIFQEDTVEAKVIKNCAIGRDGVVGEFDDDIEEGIPYITGNVLWAVYQFVVFIVLLSVLRARMVNTYHRIFREADVQWKFFR